RLETRRDVDAMPERDAAAPLDVADVDADADAEALILGHGVIAMGMRPLDRERATHGLDGARELDEERIADGFDLAPGVAGELAANHLEVLVEQLARGALALPDKRAVTHHVREHD